MVLSPVSRSPVSRSRRFRCRRRFRCHVAGFAAGFASQPIDQGTVHVTVPVGKGVTSAQPGSIDRLVLAVYDIDAARQELLSQGVEVGEVFHDAGGGLGAGFHAGAEARAPGPDPQRRSYGSYASFSDPDGNRWLLQEIKERLPGRTMHGSLNGDMTGILLEALKSAAAAHSVHEKELGRTDPDWPQWYAEHMMRTLGGAGYHLTGPSA